MELRDAGFKIVEPRAVSYARFVSKLTYQESITHDLRRAVIDRIGAAYREIPRERLP